MSAWSDNSARWNWSWIKRIPSWLTAGKNTATRRSNVSLSIDSPLQTILLPEGKIWSPNRWQQCNAHEFPQTGISHDWLLRLSHGIHTTWLVSSNLKELGLRATACPHGMWLSLRLHNISMTVNCHMTPCDCLVLLFIILWQSPRWNDGDQSSHNKSAGGILFHFRGLIQRSLDWTSLQNCNHFQLILKLVISIYKTIKRPAVFSTVHGRLHELLRASALKHASMTSHKFAPLFHHCCFCLLIHQMM